MLSPLTAASPPAGAVCQGGDRIESEENFWRSSVQSVEFTLCKVGGATPLVGVKHPSCAGGKEARSAALPSAGAASCIAPACHARCACHAPPAPQASGVCKAGPAAGDLACVEGQEGPLCDVCRPKWFKFSGVCK